MRRTSGPIRVQGSSSSPPLGGRISRQQSLLCFFVRATLERVLKFLGECNAVNGQMQSLVVLVLKPVGDIVEVVTFVDAAVDRDVIRATTRSIAARCHG